MIRNQVLKIAQTYLLPAITDLYGLSDYKITIVEEHEGGRNLVYRCENADKGDKIIRISFLPDRTTEDFLSELEFVRYLYEHGDSVSNAVDSLSGHLLEEITYKDERFFVSVFEKAKGKQLADHGYRYRKGVPLTEYFYNCGKTLGKLHALSKGYKPLHHRYSFFDKYNDGFIDQTIPDAFPLLKEKLKELIQRLERLDRNSETFGMVHFDYSDGNYMIDYETGNITVFDFDNACFCWYMYDLENVWEHGVGWIQSELDPDKRRQFMAEYFETVLKGYRSETEIDDKELENLPLFINVNLMENIVEHFKDIHNYGEELRSDEELSYLIKCLEDNIPYQGFFHEIYSSDAPFSYEACEM